MFGGKLAVVLAGLHGDQLVIEVVALADCERIVPVSSMRIKRISEFVVAFIGMRVGPFGRTQERDAQDVTLGVVTILAVVEQAESVLVVGDIRPPNSRNFKLCLLGR